MQMKKFKLTWRLAPAICTDRYKWESFLRMIDSQGDIAFILAE